LRLFHFSYGFEKGADISNMPENPFVAMLHLLVFSTKSKKKKQRFETPQHDFEL